MSHTSLRAPIIQIARASLHDGPGVRSVVYLKGCNLSCQWCHNPEGQRFEQEIVFHQRKCIECGRCVKACPVSAHIATEDPDNHLAHHVFKRDICTSCGSCAAVCPSEALQLCGKAYTPEKVLAELKHDAHYYAISGGGVTFSGGECLLHEDFLYECLRLCKAEGIHTAVETAFHVPYDIVLRLHRSIDLFIIDIKHMDSQIHRHYTGVGNERILDNIRRLAVTNANILFRTPLIPSVNDSLDNLLKTACFLDGLGRNDIQWELLKYNSLGASKYDCLGRTPAVFVDRPQDDATMKTICEHLNTNTAFVQAFFRR